jgi:glycosyltransferase involved in cell wall biosynthesis
MTACRNFTADLRMIRHSGIGRYLRNLVPLLFPLLEADSICVWGQRRDIGDAPWLTDPRVQLIETPVRVYSPQEQLLGIRHRRRGLLWVPHFNAPLWHAGPMVVTIHDIAPLVLPQILGNALKRAYARMLIQRAVRQASAILCVSAFTRSELIEKLGVPASLTTVASPGLDATWPASARPHREPDGVPYLLFVGNVKPNKNLALLLDALALVQHRLPYRLLIAGRVHGLGTGDAAVLRQAESLGPRVRFVGEIDDSALHSLYAGAAALVMPSLYEGFGLPLLEAMQLGCPVLASTAGSLPEVAADAALFFDPADAQQLAARLLQLQDSPVIHELRLRGRARVQHYSYEGCAGQTANVINSLLRVIPKESA